MTGNRQNLCHSLVRWPSESHGSKLGERITNENICRVRLSTSAPKVARTPLMLMCTNVCAHSFKFLARGILFLPKSWSEGLC